MITAKERAKLRAISNNFSDLVYIGKEGITENIIKTVNENLVAHELIKIKAQTNTDKSVKELAIELADLVNAEIVAVCGRKIILYKRTTKKDFKHYLA